MAGTRRAPAKTAVAPLTLTFEVEKETKGTFKFSEVVEGMAEPKIGSLYVRKFALGEMDWNGENLVVTIAAA